MTESEVIKELHKIRPRGGIIPQKRAEAIDVAINALEEIEQYKALGTVNELRLAKEKQIPKKPDRWESGYACCYSCKRGIVREDNYCCYCGQKLDWSDEE